MTEDDKTVRLVELAMIFYQNAEAPDANQWDVLFTHLAERNIEALESYLREWELDIGEDQ
jgi:hypothetical protein